MSIVLDIWNRLKFGETVTPLATAIPVSHVDPPNGLGKPIEPRQSYFQVRVNQMFLPASRKWFTSVEPMVMALSEFTFAGKPAIVPFVVGPGKLRDLKIQEPSGMLYRDTRVAGLHPYVGGTVSLAIVLCQVPVDNIADRFLRVLESTSQSFDFGTMLLPYLKVSHAVLDGVDALFGLGSTQALLGWRQEFDRDGGAPLASGFFALVADPAPDAATLWVKDRQLCQGPSLTAASPYRGSEFILFSIMEPTDGLRGDLDQLPINELWQRVQVDAVVTTEDGKRSFQANWTALEQNILMSPDLTEPQKDVLIEDYWKKALAFRDRALNRAVRDEPKVLDEMARIRSRSLRAFNHSY